ncbi:hypothetical protein EC991_007128 [Linnemannia zychae]|nr:hypothetical protein EC991_007128 [Linnemannia zychae]
MAACGSAADQTVEGTKYQDDLSTFLTTGSPEFYRDEILTEYHAIAVEFDSGPQQYQEQQSAQEKAEQEQDPQQSQQDVMATAVDDCVNTPEILVDGINAIENQLAEILGMLPVGAAIQYILKSVFKVVLSIVNGPGKFIGTTIAGAAINLSFGMLQGALSLLSLIRFLEPILAPVIDILSTTQKTVLNTIRCFANKGYHLNRLEQQQQQQQHATTIDEDVTIEQQPLSIGHCAWIAKHYQDLVTYAIAQNPVTKGLPQESSEDLRRVAQGALDTLEWMQKYSVASNLYMSDDNSIGSDSAGVNLASEFALTGRSFFAGKILHQYMISLLEIATSTGTELQQHGGIYDAEHDDTVLYALTSLGLTVNMSNALEACLAVANE